MKISTLSVVGVLALLTPSLALPSQPSLESRATCTNPVLRKEWRTASATEKKSYLDAVLCLATKKSTIGLNTTLYDDFAWVHQSLGQQIHNVAQFLPWHRYFIHLYEKALKGCGYTGAAMYWDWVKDSAHPASSPVWSLTTGFGGDGANISGWNNRCISGPLASLRPAYYNDQYMPHCINREFVPAQPEQGLQEMVGFNYDQSIVNDVNASNQFITFAPALENAPHAAVHYGIASRGADMSPLTSPNDPIFFLHHTQVDRLWWLWQQQNPSNRTFDYGGFDFEGNMVSLDNFMPMFNFAANRKVRDFMSTKTTDLCYKY